MLSFNLIRVNSSEAHFFLHISLTFITLKNSPHALYCSDNLAYAAAEEDDRLLETQRKLDR